MEPMTLGTYRRQPEGFDAFIPSPFPPKEGFAFNPQLLKKNDEATRLLGKLDGITRLLPNVDFFLLMYLRKDAAASSQIEGTNATMIDAIEAEAGISSDVPSDVDDILHYIQALNHGMKRVKDDEFPLSLRFLRELHKILMDSARSTHFANPGEFRASQNWIGGTRPDNAHFVPPPVPDMQRAMNDMEDFLHADDVIPTVIKAGLLHAQFEVIHPFLDGNGRTGRMLITFYLWKAGYLDKPVLFLSSYFKKHQKVYYQKLSTYHDGDVAAWIDFFLDGVIEIAKEAIEIVGEITILRESDMAKIQTLSKRASDSAIKVLPRLFAQPIVTAALVQEWTGFTRAGSQTVIDRFIELGILVPRQTGKKYGKSYGYKNYLDLFTSSGI